MGSMLQLFSDKGNSPRVTLDRILHGTRSWFGYGDAEKILVATENQTLSVPTSYHTLY
jgi:hypothetical protein